MSSPSRPCHEFVTKRRGKIWGVRRTKLNQMARQRQMKNRYEWLGSNKSEISLARSLAS